MFGQCKAITRNSSNQHTDHIIPNILVCLQYEQQRRETATTTVQNQENEVSKLAQALPLKTNTLIPYDWMENCPIHYQAHLERIGDYLIQGPGIWWQYIDTGVEFFDIETPNSNPPTPSLQHFRTSSLNDVDMYLLAKWEKCIEENIQLPAKYIRTYKAGGNVSEVRSITTCISNTCNSSTGTGPLTPCAATGTGSLTPCAAPGTGPLTPCTAPGTGPLTSCMATGTGPLTPCTATGTGPCVAAGTPPLSHYPTRHNSHQKHLSSLLYTLDSRCTCIYETCTFTKGNRLNKYL